MSNATKKRFLDMYDLEPDHELVAWEKWMRIRKDEITQLAKFTNRPAVDLVMNQEGKEREKKEWQDIIESAQIEEKCRIRDDGFLDVPERLYQPPCREQVYELKRTKVQSGECPTLEHITVPDAIKMEKGITGLSKRPIASKLDACFNNYKLKKEQSVRQKIQKVVSHRPDSNSMILIGKPFKEKNKDFREPPIISVVDYSRITSDAYEEFDNGVYAVRINNTIINSRKMNHIEHLKKEEWHENTLAWTYYFKVPLGNVGRGKLILQNLGTVSLKFSWNKIEPPTSYLIPISDKYEQKFFFCKNENVISPGQVMKVDITFASNALQIYEELWELKFLNVNFLANNDDKIIVNLVGETVEDMKNINRNIEQMKREIELEASRRMVGKLLLEIISKASVRGYPYKHYLVEADLFVMKNPVYFYHQTEVGMMKKIFSEMSDVEWDLSIISWRKELMRKEFDKRMTYYDVLKRSHRVLLMPWSEGDNLLEEKYRMVKLLLKKLADKFYVEKSNIEKRTSIMNGEKVECKRNIENSDALALTASITKDIKRSIFYLSMFEHVAVTIETCAGVLSSLDLNRWIDHNLCKETAHP